MGSCISFMVGLFKDLISLFSCTKTSNDAVEVETKVTVDEGANSQVIADKKVYINAPKCCSNQ